MNDHFERDDVTIIYSLWSWPWNRRTPRRYVLLGKQHGLKVTHEHDGGWTLRYHLITAVGADRNIRAYGKTINRLNRHLWDLLKNPKPSTSEEDAHDAR